MKNNEIFNVDKLDVNINENQLNKNNLNENILDENSLALINNITKEEINTVLTIYEKIVNITMHSGLISSNLCVLSTFGGFAAWILGAIASSFFPSLGIIPYTGCFMMLFGWIPGFIGVGIAYLGYIFAGKCDDKSDLNDKIKEYEEKIKNPKTIEYEIFRIFNEKLENNLIQKLYCLIQKEYDNLINISKNIHLDEQNYLNLFNEKFLEKMKSEIPDFHKSDKFSILALGKTGVGKTTFINSILNLEQKDTKIGLPMKMKKPQIKKYNKELFPSLDIWDSRGIELNNEFSIEEYKNKS